jgi:serine/threonine-protein kinase
VIIGKNLGDYRVLAQTRIGESGAVYKALHTSKRQTYALKLLRGSLVDSNPAQHQFLEKLRTAETLDHAHIARTYATEHTEDLTIIPLEFVYGQNLSNQIAGGPATPDFALRVALQASEALQYSHERGAIHGRLTSNTILVGSDGDLKIVDFALEALPAEMQFSDPDNGSTMWLSAPTRPLLSRLAYRAPEQVAGGSATVQSDLFALGVIVYELLVGEFLFEGDNRDELDQQIVQRDLPKVHEIRPGVPSSWTKLLRGLLDKSPANRYPSARALLEDLHRLNYGLKLDRLSFQTANPALSRRSFFRKFIREQGE